MSTFEAYAILQPDEVVSLLACIKTGQAEESNRKFAIFPDDHYSIKLPEGFEAYRCGSPLIMYERELIVTGEELLDNEYTLRMTEGADKNQIIDVTIYNSRDDFNKRWDSNANIITDRLNLNITSYSRPASENNTPPKVTFSTALYGYNIDTKIIQTKEYQSEDGYKVSYIQAVASGPLVIDEEDEIGEYVVFSESKDDLVKSVDVFTTEVKNTQRPVFGANDTFYCVYDADSVETKTFKKSFTLPKFLGGGEVTVIEFDYDKVTPGKGILPVSQNVFSRQQWKSAIMDHSHDDSYVKGSLPLCPIRIVAQDYQKGKTIIDLKINYNK